MKLQVPEKDQWRFKEKEFQVLKEDTNYRCDAAEGVGNINLKTR